MMTPRPLVNASQAAVYYEVDDYYVDGQQLSPSSWWGEGARRLGLRGPVDRETFHELLHGRLPNGVDIARGGGKSHRPGLDLTFSAPKSVSLVALVSADARVLKAHEHAVTVALSHLEGRAVRARATKEGVTRTEETDNLLVARFNHDSSRALDPQLHTHAVLLNATQRSDGAWKAIANEEIFRSVKAASVIYRAELAARLVELGYRVERTHADGRFEIAGFSESMLAAFSQRRAQIEARLDTLGLDGPKAAAVAARATRERKQDVDRSVLRREWAERAAELGIDFSLLRGMPIHSELGATRVEADRALDHAVAHFTERRVIVSERRLLEGALGFGLGRIRLDDVSRAVARKLERGELVLASSSKEKDPFARTFTTDRALAVEQELLQLVHEGRARAEPIATADHVERALADIDRQATFPLSNGQRDAIRLALTTDDRVVGIQGYAGTGKSTGALLHIRRIAASEGIEVRGFAPSAAAAEILERDAGIPSTTIARFLHHRQEKGRRASELWVVDEASMIGNEMAHALLDAAARRRARVVLVGDRDQLPAVEAGRAFGLLLDHGLKTATIDTIVRQKDPELRQAVVETIARHHEKALAIAAPRIVAIPNREQRLDAVATAYSALSTEERRDALVITSSNRDRTDLNDLIRRRLKGEQALGPDQLRASVLVQKDLTRAEIVDPTRYAVGDVIRFERRYKRLRVEKGSYLTVAAVDRLRGILNLTEADGRAIEWKPSAASKVAVFEAENRGLAVGDSLRWTRNDAERGRTNGEVGRVVAVDVERRCADVLCNGALHRVDLRRERHWEHAYASTVHAAQGRTADRVILHLDTSMPHLLGHESWYVGISRAQTQLQIFTDHPERLPMALRRSLAQESAHEAVALIRERDSSPPPKSRTKERRYGGFELGF